ncbi:uracil-DNA glycosylase [bacterium]|nr:uracil-DNA glycosylase [bacterium]MBU1993079.1 uracil-DNA glycosylase [bacterium]
MVLNDKWTKFLRDELNKDYFIKLKTHIDNEYTIRTIFPKYNDIFSAFNLLSPCDVKVVIIGQDPYHGVDQANGLAFSVCDECKIPPSLLNIFKELKEDIGCNIPACGNLSKWVTEGVLLINSVLTVVESNANSHKDLGWEIFTDSIIKKLSHEYEHIVFILWGNPSQKKALFIDENKHFIIKSPHPSPLSSYRGFFGSKPFSKTNEYLKLHHKKEIDWCLNEL